MRMRQFTRRQPHLIYDLRHKNGNLIRKWASNTIIWMPKRGNVNTTSQFSMPQIIMQLHSIHLKTQWSLIHQLRKRETHQGLHRSVSEKFFLKRKNYVTQQIRIPTWNFMWKQIRNNRIIVRPTPAVLTTIYVITRNLNAMMIKDFNSWAELLCSTERLRRRSRKYRNASRNKNVAVQKICYIPFWLFPGN